MTSIMNRGSAAGASGGIAIVIILAIALVGGASLVGTQNLNVFATDDGQVVTTLDKEDFEELENREAVPLVSGGTTIPPGGGDTTYNCNALKGVADSSVGIGNKNGASYQSEEIYEPAPSVPFITAYVYDADLGSLITADIVVVNGFTIESKLMEGFGQVEIGQKDTITVTAQAEGYIALASTRFNLDMSAYAYCEQDKVTEFVFYMSMAPDVEPTIEYACERYGQTVSTPYDWLSSVEDANCERALCVNGINLSGYGQTDSYLDWNFEESECQWYGIEFPPPLNGGGYILGCPEGFTYVDGEGCVEEAPTSTSPPGLTTTQLDVHNCRWTGHGSGFSVSPCTYLIQHSDDITIEDFWQDAAPEYNWKVGDITKIEQSGSSDENEHCTIKEYNPRAGWQYTSVRCIEIGNTFLGADGDLGKLDNCAGTTTTEWHSQTISLTSLLNSDPYILDYRQQYSDYRGGGGSGGASVYYDEGGYYFSRDATCSGPRPNEFRIDFTHSAEDKYLVGSGGELQLTTDSEMWILIPQHSDLTLFEGGVQDSYEVVNVDGIVYFRFNMGRIHEETSPNVCDDPGQAIPCLGGEYYSQAKLNLRKWDATVGERRLSII